MNELLDFLDLDNTELGNVFGWSFENATEDGYQWIDFWMEKVTLDDGLEYTIIYCPFSPEKL